MKIIVESFYIAAFVLILSVLNAESGTKQVQTFYKTRVVSKQGHDIQFNKVHQGKDDLTLKSIACPKGCLCSNNGMVNCSRLGLSAIPPLPKNVTYLDVSGNEISVLPDKTFSSYPSLQQVDFSGNRLSDKSFSNKTFSETKLLTQLDISYNSFSTVPSHLPVEVETLWLYSCNIRDLTSPSLTLYLNLTYLDLAQNRLDAIPPNLNNFFPNLKHFDVSFNNISTIHNATFEKTVKLESIILRFNKLTKVPSHLPSSLLNLDLVGNLIPEIQENTFAHLTKLETLSMWESPLTAIQDFAFNGLAHVTILDFMECHVTSAITNYTFHGLKDVQTIDLSLSNITIMDSGALLGLDKLQYLWLNDNPFKTLNPLLFDHKTIPSISEIYLWGNNWKCDCKLKWLKEMQEASSVIQDPHLMTCAEPAPLKGRTWDDLHSSQFVC